MQSAPTVDEKATLRAYLDAQRNHVLGILEDLPVDDLKRSMLPSGWNALELIHHLALDDERFWFPAVISGEQSVIDEVMNGGDDAWQVPTDLTPEAVFTLYRQEIQRSNAVIEGVSLDASPQWWPDFFGTFRLDTVREVILHVIVETACHAGHADAARELIDGRTWMVLNK